MKGSDKMKLFEAFGQISDEHITEASEESIMKIRARAARRTKIMRIVSTAACFCVLAVGVVVAIPKTGQVNIISPDSGEVITPDSGAETDITQGIVIDDGGFHIEDGVSLSYSGTGSSVTVPSSVTRLSSATFENYAGASDITHLTLVSSETRLDEGALAPLTALESVIISGGGEANPDLSTLLDMTVTDTVNGGYSLTYAYTRHGGSPVYRVGPFEGIYLEYGPNARSDYDDLHSPLCGDAKPIYIHVTKEANDEISVFPGVKVGMNASDAVKLGCDFDYVGMDVEDGSILLGYMLGGYRVILHLQDVPTEMYEMIPYDTTQEHLDRCTKLQEEFCRAPVGRVSMIEIWRAEAYEGNTSI